MESVKYVSYRRVSTKSKQDSGLGLEAQQRDIELFLKSQGGELMGQFVDIESGAKDDRAELTKALEFCRSTGYTFLSSKVDRVSRDVEFWAKLCKDKKLKIKVAQIPNADTFQIHLFAALGHAEREFISSRTKAALAAAKARGVVLGNPNLSELNKTRVRTAQKAASQYAPIVVPLREKGMTYQEIADTLNNMGLKSRNGCGFYPTTVKRILDRNKTN